jgi:hypothetical protein
LEKDLVHRFSPRGCFCASKVEFVLQQPVMALKICGLDQF